MSGDRVFVQVLRHVAAEVRDVDDVGVPGVDLLHVDVRHPRELRGDVDRPGGLQPVLPIEIASRRLDVPLAVVEEDQGARPLEALHAVQRGLNLVVGLPAVFDDSGRPVLLLENLSKELDPALEGPDGVEPREGRRKPYGGNARQGQLPCVGCRLHPVEHDVGLQLEQLLGVQHVPLQELGAGPQDAGRHAGQQGMCRGRHRAGMDPHQLVPGPLEKAVDGRQGPGARDDDALDLRRYAHLLAGVVDDHPRRLPRAGLPGRSPLRRVGGGRRSPSEAQKQQQNGTKQSRRIGKTIVRKLHAEHHPFSSLKF